jgi:Ca2+-binding RTX toxin-like protein
LAATAIGDTSAIDRQRATESAGILFTVAYLPRAFTGAMGLLTANLTEVAHFVNPCEDGDMRTRGQGRAARASAIAAVVIALCEPLLSPSSGSTLRRCDIEGTPAADRLVGTARNEVICGRGGDDTIWGYGGGDEIHGGPGRDRIMGGIGEDLVRGGIGSDKLRGGPAEDRLIGGVGRDIMRGQKGPDFLDGIDGTDARDVLYAGPGKDACAIDGRDVTIGCETVVA